MPCVIDRHRALGPPCSIIVRCAWPAQAELPPLDLHATARDREATLVEITAEMLCYERPARKCGTPGTDLVCVTRRSRPSTTHYSAPPAYRHHTRLPPRQHHCSPSPVARRSRLHHRRFPRGAVLLLGRPLSLPRLPGLSKRAGGRRHVSKLGRGSSPAESSRRGRGCRDAPRWPGYEIGGGVGVGVVASKIHVAVFHATTPRCDSHSLSRSVDPRLLASGEAVTWPCHPAIQGTPAAVGRAAGERRASAGPTSSDELWWFGGGGGARRRPADEGRT